VTLACNSQIGSAFGSHWAPSLIFFPICESVFHTKTHFLGFMGPCTPHLITNPMLRLWHFYFFIVLNLYTLKCYCLISNVNCVGLQAKGSCFLKPFNFKKPLLFVTINRLVLRSIYHKLISFIILFEIHMKYVISWVCVFYTQMSCI
jgi:hypothetical protein